MLIEADGRQSRAMAAEGFASFQHLLGASVLQSKSGQHHLSVSSRHRGSLYTGCSVIDFLTMLHVRCGDLTLFHSRHHVVGVAPCSIASLAPHLQMLGWVADIAVLLHVPTAACIHRASQTCPCSCSCLQR